MDESLRKWQRKGFEDPFSHVRYLQELHRSDPTISNYATYLDHRMNLEKVDLMEIPIELYDERIVRLALAQNLNNLTVCGKDRSFVTHKISQQVDWVLHTEEHEETLRAFSTPWTDNWYILQRLAIAPTSGSSAEWIAIVSNRNGYSWWAGDIECPFIVDDCQLLKVGSFPPGPESWFHVFDDYGNTNCDFSHNTGYEMGTEDHYNAIMQNRHGHIREQWQAQEADGVLSEYLTLFVQF